MGVIGDDEEASPINYQCPHCGEMSSSKLMTDLFEIKNKEIRILKTQLMTFKLLIGKIKSAILETRL